MRASRFVISIVFMGVVGCRTATPPPATTQVAPRAKPAAVATPTADPDSIRWVRDSAEYRALALQVYRAATEHVERAATGRAGGSWAVVLDADETVLSNLQYQLERARAGLPYTPESWTAWVRQRAATPVPGAAAFLARTRELGGRIAIVTNRLQSECDDTAAVFASQHLVYDIMLCRPDGGPSDKNPRFRSVTDGTSPAGGPPLDVVAFLGDNILDFPLLSQAVRKDADPAFGEFGVRYFVLPNPMYGSWQ